MIHLTVRRLRRHWRVNIAMLLCLTLASILLASISGYAAAIATRELNQNLAKASPAERSLLITGTPFTFSEALYASIQERLGQVLKERLEIRHITLPADPQPLNAKQLIARLEVYSFDNLPQNVRLVKGRLPAQIHLGEAIGSWPPPVEAVIGAHAAEQSGYNIGDRLTANKLYYRLDIVGIIEPLDPHDDVWGEDLSAFVADPDANTLPLIISPASMQGYLGQPIFPHEIAWRITLNHSLISVNQVEALRSDLVNFQTQSATQGAKTSTGLIQIFADYLTNLSRARVAFLWPTAQTFIFVLYTLTLFTSFLLDRSQTELATLSGHGASAWQIAWAFGLEKLILALFALLLGVGLTQAVLSLWGKLSGEFARVALPAEAWLLAGITAGLGWLMWVLPVFLAARHGLSAQRPALARPPQQSLAQKRYLDIYLLAFGVLLYWQLGQSGSFVMRAVARSQLNTQLADPLLLVGPLLLLLALAMVFLRLLPYALRLLAWVWQRQSGSVLALSLSRLARDPLYPSHMVLLVSLTTGFVFFARTFGDWLVHHQETLRLDPLAQSIGGAFQLNALALLVFSVTAFSLLHFLAAQGRAREFSLLRAMGFSVRQSLASLNIEGLVVVSLGLLVGGIAGWGLSWVMIPYLAQSLGGSPVGIGIEQIVINWPGIARLYLLLIIVYGLALALVSLVLVRTRAHWTAWEGDE